ncbi:AAA family ATPase, partial [Methylomagnum sp.]
ALGVALGGAGGVALGVALGVAFGVAWGVAWGVAGGVALGGAGGGALGVASTLATSHLLNLVFQLPIASLGWILVRQRPQTSRFFWRIHPIRWDEIILLPLPGTPRLLVSLYHLDDTAGRAALAETAAHKFQYRAAYKAWAILAQEQAEGIASLETLARYADGLDWFNEETPLAETLRAQLFTLRDISQEVASALESDSATNQLRRMAEAKRRLDALAKQPPGPFSTAIRRWSDLINTGLEDARRRQRQEEPIPQAYQWDGKPVRPDGNPDERIPFKGRRALFRRLELALGNHDGPRQTYLLIGQRRSGKTSALLQLERRLGARVVPAFLDLQSATLGGAADSAGLLHGLAAAVNDEARRRGVVLPDLTRRELGTDPYPAFGRWLDATEHALADRRLLLCLDEYESLEQGIAAGRFDERLLMALRHTVQHRRRVDVLLSGSRPIDELPPRWASALINTLSLPISFLEPDDARELIVRPVADFPAHLYRDEAVKRILHLSHAQPYLVQLLCATLVERMNKTGRMPPASQVDLADVTAIIPTALERGGNYFSNLWHGQAGSETARLILETLAHPATSALYADALRKLEPDNRALNTALRTLLRREIVEKGEDGRYRIVVPLVAEYVRGQRVI